MSAVALLVWVCPDCEWESGDEPHDGLCPICLVEVITWDEWHMAELRKLAPWTAASEGARA